MSELPTDCEECGKTLSPQQREDSYHATFSPGEGGSVLCETHLDRTLRERDDRR